MRTAAAWLTGLSASAFLSAPCLALAQPQSQTQPQTQNESPAAGRPSSPAQPQPPQTLTLPKAPAATPQQIAAAKAEAGRLIAAAHAERYFVDVTTGAAPRVRHTPSGLVCGFTPGEAANDIHVYQSAGVAGEDVSCNTRIPTKDGPVTFTLYATRQPQTPTLRQQLSADLAAMRVNIPDLKPADGTFGNVTVKPASGDPPPPHAALRMEGTVGGQRSFTRVGAGVVGSWVISQRVSAPFAAAVVADAIGEITLADAVEQVSRAPGAAADIAQARIAAQDAASDEAKRLLRGLGPMFVDRSGEGVTRIEHIPSGVVCRFGPDPKTNRLSAGPAGFLCGAATDYGVQILEGLYMPQPTEAQVSAVIDRVTARQPEAHPVAGFTDVAVPDPALPPFSNRRYMVSEGAGRELFLHQSYVQLGDWLLVQTVASPPAALNLADRGAQLAFIDILRTAAARQGASASSLAQPPTPKP